MTIKREIENIKAELINGIISYDDAKAKAQPVIDELNRKAREIAKKYGKKHHNFTFAGLMR